MRVDNSVRVLNECDVETDVQSHMYILLCAVCNSLWMPVVHYAGET